MVKREAESDASAASQTKWKLEGSQCVLRNRRRYPMPRSGEEAYIEIKPAATGERSGSPDMWLCRRQGHTHTSHRYWRESQKMDNKRGFGEARGKMHVLGELLGWRRGWLAGACGWNAKERARVEQRGTRDQSKNSTAQKKGDETKKLLLLLLRVLCVKARDESRTRRANRRSL